MERAKREARDYADLGYRLELGAHIYENDILPLCSYFSEDFNKSMDSAEDLMTLFDSRVSSGKQGSAFLYMSRLLYERAFFDVNFLLEYSEGLDFDLTSYDNEGSFEIDEEIPFDASFNLKNDLDKVREGYELCLLAMEYPTRYFDIYSGMRSIRRAAVEERFEDAAAIRDNTYGAE
ncbi:MAG: hypothetical protein ACI83O_000184 [Patescibacteria group bacterium]|jgi:hypothetical protein